VTIGIQTDRAPVRGAVGRFTMSALVITLRGSEGRGMSRFGNSIAAAVSIRPAPTDEQKTLESVRTRFGIGLA